MRILYFCYFSYDWDFETTTMLILIFKREGRSLVLSIDLGSCFLVANTKIEEISYNLYSIIKEL